MNSSDGISPKVGIGVVSFVAADDKAASQVFRRLQEDCSEDDTERSSPFDLSSMFESVVAVVSVVVDASMLDTNFFMMIEKNTYIFKKEYRIGSRCFVVDVAAVVETCFSVPSQLFCS
jgi:hypothetical protein